MSIHLCAPTGWTFRTVRQCHDCGQRRRHLITVFEWYGPSSVCCACGVTVNDGYRPPYQYDSEKKKRADRARQDWSAAMTRQQAMTAVTDAVADTFGVDP